MFSHFVHLTDGNEVSLAPTCSGYAAELDLAFSASDDYSIRVRIDYVCIGNDNQTVSGNLQCRLFTLIATVLNYGLSSPCLEWFSVTPPYKIFIIHRTTVS